MGTKDKPFSPELARVGEEISGHLDQIKSLFKNSEPTLLVRGRNAVDQDLIMSNDNAVLVELALRRTWPEYAKLYDMEFDVVEAAIDVIHAQTALDLGNPAQAMLKAAMKRLHEATAELMAAGDGEWKRPS